MQGLIAGLIVLGFPVAAAKAVEYCGIFGTAAQAPHWGITGPPMTMRDRTIAVRARIATTNSIGRRLNEIGLAEVLAGPARRFVEGNG